MVVYLFRDFFSNKVFFARYVRDVTVLHYQLNGYSLYFTRFKKKKLFASCFTIRYLQTLAYLALNGALTGTKTYILL